MDIMCPNSSCCEFSVIKTDGGSLGDESCNKNQSKNVDRQNRENIGADNRERAQLLTLGKRKKFPPVKGKRSRQLANELAENERYLRKIGKPPTAVLRETPRHTWGHEPTLTQTFFRDNKPPRRPRTRPCAVGESLENQLESGSPCHEREVPVALWLFLAGGCLVVMAHIVYLLVVVAPTGPSAAALNHTGEGIPSLLRNIDIEREVELLRQMGYSCNS